MGLPSTSLIICTRNRPRLLLDTVKSVLEGRQVPSELIVVDQSDKNYPDLGLSARDHQCQIRLLRSSTVGLGRAKNVGISEARHQILVFTDDDVVAAPAWFECIVEALLETGRQGVVTGQVLPATADKPGGFAPSIKIDKSPALFTGRPGVDPLLSGNMGIFSDAIHSVGLFDERLGAGSRFPSSEDNDLGFRLLEAGYLIRYVPEAIVYHRAWRPYRDYLPLQWSYGRGQGAFYAKHMSLSDRYMLRRMVHDILFRLALSPRHLWRRWLHAGLGHILFVLGMVSGAAEWRLTQ